jgi:guanylate kinase
VKKGKVVIKETDLKGLKMIREEHPDFDTFYSVVFLNIPKEKLSERIEQRGVFMSDEEYTHRMKSAEIEEEELCRICDYQIDATLSPEQVLEKFLEIVSSRA